MNCSYLYESLIRRAQSRQIDNNTIYEKHHIIPRSFGGSDSTENLVHLTLREHYFAHVLLYKMHCNDRKKRGQMISALNRMIHCRRYTINSHHYEFFRSAWMRNHPAKLDKTKTLIKESLRQYRLNNGYSEVICACGCGCSTGAVSLKPINKFIDGHRPKRVKSVTKFIKCACGCGEDTYKIITKTVNPALTKIFKNGHDVEKNHRVGKMLSQTLSNMTPTQKRERMKNSTAKGNTKDRAKAISRGKASIIEITLLDGSVYSIASDDTAQISKLTGLTWAQLRYRINRYGSLITGETVRYTKQFIVNRNKSGNNYNS